MTKAKLIVTVLVSFLFLSILMRAFYPRQNYDNLSIRLYLNVEESHEVHMLVKVDPHDKYYLDSASSEQRKTELYKYNEDGWRCADYYVKGVSYTGRTTDTYTGEYDANRFTTQLTDNKFFIPHFESFKAAECDNEGNIVKVLDEISMISQNNNDYYFVYDLNKFSDTKPGASVIEHKYTGSLWGFTNNRIEKLMDFSIRAAFYIMLIFHWVVLGYLIMVVGKARGGISDVGYVIIYILLSGVHIAMAISDIIIAWYSFVSHHDSEDIISEITNRFFVITFPWIIATVLFWLMREHGKQNYY